MENSIDPKFQLETDIVSEEKTRFNHFVQRVTTIN